MATLSQELTIYNTSDGNPVGRIRLNGYNIMNEESSFIPGKMQSFIIVDGTLWDYWNKQAPLLLDTTAGRTVSVRIAAYPVDYDSFGLLEYI